MCLEQCFQEEFSRRDKLKRGFLDHNKITYREIFNQHMDEMVDSFPLESTKKKLNMSTLKRKEIKVLDQDITFSLSKVRKI